MKYRNSDQGRNPKKNGQGQAARLFNTRYMPLVLTAILLLLVLYLGSIIAIASPVNFQGGDSLFQKAHALAFSGERQEAREVCFQILNHNPDYHDARVLLASLYAKDGQFDAARKQIEYVLHRREDHTDAYNILVDVDRWSGNLDTALLHSIEGLSHDPTSESLLYKKALTLKDLGQLEEAKRTLRRLLEVNSLHEKGHQFLDRLELVSASNALQVDYGFEDIDSFENPWHLVSLEYSRATRMGSLMGRVNYANRFGGSMIQYEVDAYPNIARGLYAYLNLGYSPSGSFPEYRYGGELFADLSRGIEFSLGFRHLQFESSDVTIYTGNIGKYVGNYWFSFRPYITPRSLGASRSYKLSARRYFGTADSFLGVSFGFGSNVGDDLTTVVDLIRLGSYQIRLDAEFLLGRRTTVDWFADYSREDLPFGRERTRFKVGLGFERRF